MPNQFTSTHQTQPQWLAEAINSTSNECLIWPFILARDGYGTIKFKRKSERAHRVAFYLANGHWPIPMARHTCDTPACVNPRHLIEGNQRQNYADAAARNRNSQGERHGMSKLTEALVVQIRSEYVFNDPLHSTVALARKFRVSQGIIHSVVARKIWKHVL